MGADKSNQIDHKWFREKRSRSTRTKPLKRNVPKKNGLVPIMCRITVNGKIAQFLREHVQPMRPMGTNAVREAVFPACKA